MSRVLKTKLFHFHYTVQQNVGKNVSPLITLRAKLSGAVYFNRSCLFVGLWLCLFVCGSEGSEADVSRRIGIARGIFHALSKVWTSKDIKKSTKIEVFEIL